MKTSVSNSFKIKLPDIHNARLIKNGKNYQAESLKGDIASVNLEKK